MVYFIKQGGVSDLMGFTNSDYAGDMEDSKSTLGYVFMMSGGAVAWSSRKQPIVTLSTTETEFVAANAYACQAIWIRRILKEIGHSQIEETKLMYDNTSTIKLSKNPILYGCFEHIRVRFHFFRDLTKEGTVNLLFCGTRNQLANLLTKPLKLEAFQKLSEEFGVQSFSNLN